jgi:hypothetical protein
MHSLCIAGSAELYNVCNLLCIVGMKSLHISRCVMHMNYEYEYINRAGVIALIPLNNNLTN